MNISFADITSIVTSIGVLGTLALGFINLYSLRQSEISGRRHNLSTADYEKRRDYTLTTVSEYLQLLDSRNYTYMALTDEEYEGKDLETYHNLYSLQTVYYRIKLMINPSNPLASQFSDLLDETMSLVEKMRSENCFAEMMSHAFRTPERAMKVSKTAIRLSQNHNSYDANVIPTKPLDYISDMVKEKDKHLHNYLSAIEELEPKKKQLVKVVQNYLQQEKQLLLS